MFLNSGLLYLSILLPRMLTLKTKTLSPTRDVYVAVSDSWAECIISFLLVPSAWIVTLLVGCISVPSLYHLTTPSDLDTSHDRTSCSCSTTLWKRSLSGISANVTGGAAEKNKNKILKVVFG